MKWSDNINTSHAPTLLSDSNHSIQPYQVLGNDCKVIKDVLITIYPRGDICMSSEIILPSFKSRTNPWLVTSTVCQKHVVKLHPLPQLTKMTALTNLSVSLVLRAPHLPTTKYKINDISNELSPSHDGNLAYVFVKNVSSNNNSFPPRAEVEEVLRITEIKGSSIYSEHEKNVYLRESYYHVDCKTTWRCTCLKFSYFEQWYIERLT